MPKNADICRVLFSGLQDSYFKCKYCGTVRRQLPSSGYGNLVSHLKDKHPQYEADYVAHASATAGNLHSFGFVDDKMANVFRWMEWVVDRHMPLSEVDHPVTRAMSRLKPISSKTLKKYMTATTEAVERAVAAVIPPHFGLMFDGWSCYSEHYVALYAVFWRDGQLEHPLLALAPLDEADLTAESHCSFIGNILAIFGQSTTSLKFLVGDNCATNQLIATKLDVPLVGCASHRFNLASKNFLAEHEDLVEAVSTLMTALRTTKNRAELRRHSSLAPLRANATRWSSTFMMLERYVRIRDAVKRVDSVYDLVPKPAAHRRIVALVESLKTFNSVCKKLQEDTVTIGAVRVLFDKISEMFPVTQEYLLPDARIVHSPAFESAIVKVSTGATDLSRAELDALEPFRIEGSAAEAEPSAPRRQARALGDVEDFATAHLRAGVVGESPTPSTILL